jgi:hypothetical protein
MKIVASIALALVTLALASAPIDAKHRAKYRAHAATNPTLCTYRGGPKSTVWSCQQTIVATAAPKLCTYMGGPKSTLWSCR